MECAGLSEEQLRQRAVPPSPLSLLGLVRPLAEVERGWLRQVMAGEQVADIWGTAERPDADLQDDQTADAAAAFTAWQGEVDMGRQVVAGTALDSAGQHRSGQVSLRWVLTHLIEEYARHNGHADLLRERIDGSTGE